VRCTRNRAGPVPGICLYERRIDAADVVVRFPRDWLRDWRWLPTSSIGCSRACGQYIDFVRSNLAAPAGLELV
jgi:hypothetical protein